MNGKDVTHAALGSLVNNLGSLVPLGASLIAMVIWLNGEFRALERSQAMSREAIRALTWCVLAREGNPNFKCPIVGPQ